MNKALFPKIVKLLGVGSCGYLTFTIFQAVHYEKQVKQLEIKKKQFQIRGNTYQENEQDQKLNHYMDNHYGIKLLEQIQAKQNLEQQLQKTIDEKTKLRQQLVHDNNEEAVQKIEDEIEQLNQLFTNVKPKPKLFKKQ